MGLFGLFYTAFYATGCAVNSIKNSLENDKCKTNNVNIEYQTYTDIGGNTRLLETDEIVEIRPNENKDICMYKQFSKTPYRNLSQERREKKYLMEKDIDNGSSVVEYGRMRIGGLRLTAFVYKDKATGELMFDADIREFHSDKKSHHFYISVKDGHIIRPTDYELEVNQRWLDKDSKNYRKPEWYDDFIQERNNREFLDVFNDGFNHEYISCY